MTTSHDPREPLDADERELAARLARLGPLDGPSPALDAKILAAAHAAAAGSRPRRGRRRWVAWIGVPPAAITGVGMAAAAVLALGLVWQMRPRVAMVPAAQESGEEVFVMAEPAGERAPVVNPPPFSEQASAAADTAAPRQAPEPALVGAQAAKARADEAQSGGAGPQGFPVAPPAAEAPREVAAAAAPAPAANDVLGRGNDAAAAATAAATEEETAPEAAAASADAARDASAKQRRATYTSSARARAVPERREAPMAAPPPMAAPIPASPARQSAEAFPDSPTELDKVEVTGSRIRGFVPGEEDLSRILPRDDALLGREDWLARIHARKHAGQSDPRQLESARESLRLFRRTYPQARIPDDLRSLMATDPAP